MVFKIGDLESTHHQTCQNENHIEHAQTVEIGSQLKPPPLPTKQISSPHYKTRLVTHQPHTGINERFSQGHNCCEDSDLPPGVISPFAKAASV
jgi:hypothetical protein